MRLRIAPLLLGLLVATAATSTASSLFAWLALREDTARMDALHGDTIRPLQDLKALSDAYAVSVVDAAHKIRNGNFTWEEGAAALEDARRVIERSWTTLAATRFDAAAASAFTDAGQRRAVAEALATELRRVVAARDAAALDTLIRERLYAAIDPFTESIGAPIDALVASARASVRTGLDRLGQQVTMLAVLVLLALTTTIAAGWIVLARVTGPVTRLTGAMERLPRGDLEITVPGAGRRDEIGAMAAAVEVFKQGAADRGYFPADRVDHRGHRGGRDRGAGHRAVGLGAGWHRRRNRRRHGPADRRDHQNRPRGVRRRLGGARGGRAHVRRGGGKRRER